jgi:hypothetical protein
LQSNAFDSALEGTFPAILIIEIVFLKACLRAFKKTLLVFPAPSALETPKAFS